MEKIFYLGMMIAAGLLFGLQSPINAQLSRSVGVLEGSFLSFLGGTLVLGLGALPPLMAMILGNLIMGCVIDHFGWFGIPVTLFTWRRFLGVLLVLLGLLIAFKR